MLLSQWWTYDCLAKGAGIPVRYVKGKRTKPIRSSNSEYMANGGISLSQALQVVGRGRIDDMGIILDEPVPFRSPMSHFGPIRRPGTAPPVYASVVPPNGSG